MINKQQLAALIKAVEEGGDDDDEITEDEANRDPAGHRPRRRNPIRSGMVCLGAVSKAPTVNMPSSTRRFPPPWVYEWTLPPCCHVDRL